MLKRLLGMFMPMEGIHNYLTSNIAYITRRGKVITEKHSFRQNKKTGEIEILTKKCKWIKLSHAFAGISYQRVSKKIEERFAKEFSEFDDSEPPKSESTPSVSDGPDIRGIMADESFLN